MENWRTNFQDLHVIDEITDLEEIARLRTLKGKVLKKGVPIKQLQKYNKKDDDGNYSNTSSDTESEDQPKKKRQLSSSPVKSDVHDVDSNKNSKTPASVKQSVNPSVKQSVNPSVKQSVNPSVKQSVNPSVKQSVNPSVKQSVNPSVKQSVNPSVTENMINEKESFTPSPTRTQYNGKKTIITQVNSPITQIKGGIKKNETTQKKIFFPAFHKRGREIGNRNRIVRHTPRFGQ